MIRMSRVILRSRSMQELFEQKYNYSKALQDGEIKLRHPYRFSFRRNLNQS